MYGRVSNHRIISGFIPLLVVDVWEHAYLLDYDGRPARNPYMAL